MKQKRGFTLLELLIVISIMVALMGLLLPAISHMKEKGKEQLNEIVNMSNDVSLIEARTLLFVRYLYMGFVSFLTV